MTQEKKQSEFEFRSSKAPVHSFFPSSSVPSQGGFKRVSPALEDFLREKAMGPQMPCRNGLVLKLAAEKKC